MISPKSSSSPFSIAPAPLRAGLPAERSRSTLCTEQCIGEAEGLCDGAECWAAGVEERHASRATARARRPSPAGRVPPRSSAPDAQRTAASWTAAMRAAGDGIVRDAPGRVIQP